MKSAIIFAAAAAGLANAKPHGHAHVHHKRVPDAVSVNAPVSTALAFVLSDGQPISHDQVCQGIASGELKWDGDAPDGACAAPSSIAVQPYTPPSSTSAPVSSSSAAAGAFYAQSSPQASPSAAASSSSSSSGSGVNLGNIVNFVASLAQSSYPDFQDGVHLCSDGPPSQYGALPVDYLNLNGWLSVQKLNPEQNDILSDGSECTDGSSCSYTCAPGYQKTQWVTSQPADGASIGGLLCKGEYLYKANSNPQICEEGTGGVTVQNNGGDDFCVCRTNYPGDEAETVPVDVAAGSSQPLTCPDESDYYQHLGQKTSAQYYLNNWGVRSNPGCSWNGNGDHQSGNWAPMNFGVGSTNGIKWLSLMQNAPTSTAVFSGTVNITGDGISGSCSFEPDADGKDGQYCGNGVCQRISGGGTPGCTVSVTGNAAFVVSQ